MNHSTDARPAATGPETSPIGPPSGDLVTLLQQVLEASPEPLTAARVNTLLPRPYCETLIEQVLIRQVTARVLYEFPSYRGQRERYWVRPMPAFVAGLIQRILADGPLAWTEIRRRLPEYARSCAETVLQQMLAAGTVFQHPRVGRSGPRFGVRPAEIIGLVRDELERLFLRLERRGLCPTQVRAAALDVLHEEQWFAPHAYQAPARDAAAVAVGAAVSPLVSRESV